MTTRASRALAALLGVEHPIVQAPLAGAAASPALVAAVSNAGALGSLGAAYLSPVEITAAIAEIRWLTGRPFAVNLFAGGRDPAADAGQLPAGAAPMLALIARYHAALGLPAPTVPAVPPDPFEEQLEAVLAAGAPVFSFAFGIPSRAALDALAKHGTVVMGTATTVAEARAVDAAGVHAVIAQGSEAGGHRSTFLGPIDAGLVGTMALVPQVADAVSAPVVASGGIMDARGVVAAHALGAAGVQMGTAFLLCDESGAAEAYKAALLAARDDRTTLTRVFSGRPARGLVNRFIADVEAAGVEALPFPLQNALTRPMRTAAAARGDAGAMSLWAGQAAALGRRRPAADLVGELVRECARLVRDLAAPDSETAEGAR